MLLCGKKIKAAAKYIKGGPYEQQLLLPHLRR